MVLGIVCRIENGQITGSLARIMRVAKKMGHSIILYNVEDVMIQISQSTHGYDHIYDAKTGVKLVLPTVVLWRAGGSGKSGLNLLRFFINKKIPVSHAPTSITNCADKFLTHLLLSKNRGIRNPKTVLLNNLTHSRTAINRIGGFPVMLKEVVGSQGTGIHFANSDDEVKTHVKYLKNKGVKSVLIQSFIETGKDKVSDYRIFIVGGKIVATMKRTSTDKKSKIANISAGGKGEAAEISKENQTMCIEAARAVGIENSITGVDLLTDSKGTGYIIEVNSNPGLKIEDYTGVNVALIIILFMEQLSNMKGRDLVNNNYSKILSQNSIAFSNKLKSLSKSEPSLSPRDSKVKKAIDGISKNFTTDVKGLGLTMNDLEKFGSSSMVVSFRDGTNEIVSIRKYGNVIDDQWSRKNNIQWVNKSTQEIPIRPEFQTVIFSPKK